MHIYIYIYIYIYNIKGNNIIIIHIIHIIHIILFHNVLILIKSVFNENQNCYYFNIFLEKGLYENKLYTIFLNKCLYITNPMFQ